MSNYLLAGRRWLALSFVLLAHVLVAQPPPDPLADLYKAYRQAPSDHGVAQAIHRLELAETSAGALPAASDSMAIRNWLLAEVLAEQQTLVRYYLHAHRLYILAYGSLGSTFVQFTLSATDLRQKIETLLGLLSRPQTEPSDIRRRATLLYQILIDPVATVLQRKLLILPHDALTRLPFGLLVVDTEEPDVDLAATPLPYLLQYHDISYTYSGRMQADLRSAVTAPRFDKVLALQATSSPAPTRPDSTLPQTEVAPLPHAADEIAAIGQSLPTTVLTGRETSVDNFCAQAPDYRILHLATHAAADTLVPYFLWQSAYQREQLKLPRIEQLRLHSDLVVLNGCQTGHRTTYTQPSLGQAFLAAGARSVVATQWPVSDWASAKLMPFFYRFLAAGYAKDRALAAAQTEFLRQYPGKGTHPYYWGAYQLLGDGDRLAATSYSSGTWYWSGGMLLGLIILWRFRK